MCTRVLGGGGAHYWCKVVRTVGSLTGVWLHNDLENGGIAKFESSDLEVIGGTSPNTSWVMYSRAPTAKESSTIRTANNKIHRSLESRKAVVHPFSQMDGEDNLGVAKEKALFIPDEAEVFPYYKNRKQLADFFLSDDEYSEARLGTMKTKEGD